MWLARPLRGHCALRPYDSSGIIGTGRSAPRRESFGPLSDMHFSLSNMSSVPRFVWALPDGRFSPHHDPRGPPPLRLFSSITGTSPTTMMRSAGTADRANCSSVAS